MNFVPPTASYAVIFCSQRRDGDHGYGEMAEAMVELAQRQPGFIAMRSSRGADGLGLTVSYWDSLQAIAAWRAVAEHRAARDQGRAAWYSGYELQVVKIERAYAWDAVSDGVQDPVLAR
jgi:heme-degrading monooxygenase HmoA